MSQFYPKITAKQEGGDDGYCYVIRIDGKEFVNGLTRHQLTYYKEQALLFWYGRQLRKEFPTLSVIDSERKARELIKLNAEYNYKVPRKPIGRGGCCELEMAVELEDRTDLYCPIHGLTQGEPFPKKAVTHG